MTRGPRLADDSLGVVLLIGVIALATLETVLLRWLGDQISMGQTLLARAGVQLVVISFIGLGLQRRGRELFRTQRLGGHLGRSVMAAVAWLCYYTSFQVLPLGLATTLTFSSQFFVLLLSRPILRERVSLGSVVGTTVGFAGVLVSTGLWDPQQSDWRIIFGFISSLLGAFMLLMTRSLTFTESTDTILFYMPLVVFFTALPQAWLDWRPLTVQTGGLLLLFGLVGTLASWGHVQAYRHGRPSVLAPWTYLRLGMGVGAGAWFFGDPLTMAMAAGVGLILLGALIPRMNLGLYRPP